jgi:hypothetical protein
MGRTRRCVFDFFIHNLERMMADGGTRPTRCRSASESDPWSKLASSVGGSPRDFPPQARIRGTMDQGRGAVGRGQPARHVPAYRAEKKIARRVPQHHRRHDAAPWGKEARDRALRSFRRRKDPLQDTVLGASSLSKKCSHDPRTAERGGFATSIPKGWRPIVCRRQSPRLRLQRARLCSSTRCCLADRKICLTSGSRNLSLRWLRRDPFPPYLLTSAPT